MQRRFAEIIETTNKNIRVACFSELNNSVLMWAHYADSNAGICIEYDFLESDTLRPFLQPVLYDNQIFKMGSFEQLTALCQLAGYSIRKSKDWEYEAEWRLTIQRRNDFLPNKISVPKPKAIYLGTRFDLNSEADKSKLMSVANRLNIPVYKMEKHSIENGFVTSKLPFEFV